jgi:anthranilate 1,2-dioxygenase small subunit
LVDAGALARIDALQLRYIAALDRFDLEAWLGCFAAETKGYVCTTRENEEQGLPLAIMMDDSRERLMDRIKFIDRVWAGTFEPYTTRHFVQRLDCRETAPGRYAVTSNVLVAYTSARRHSEILAAGAYDDTVEVAGGDALFVAKRAILDTVTTPRYLVYPV